jgi:hypothetical protein
LVGLGVGDGVGSLVGFGVGDGVGASVGLAVGDGVGAGVGVLVGDGVGAGVGSTLHRQSFPQVDPAGHPSGFLAKSHVSPAPVSISPLPHKG